MTHPQHRLIIALIWTVIGVIAPIPDRSNAAELATWLGGTGQWTDASKWDTLVPDNGSVEYDVVFGFDFFDEVTLGRDIEINNLHFLGGTIDGGPFELTLNSVPYPPGSIWEAHTGSSTMEGAGVTRVPEGGTLEIIGGSGLAPTLSRRTLINSGETFLSGTGSLRGQNDATITNEGLFDIRGDGDLSRSSATFTNSGNLHKSAGTSTSTISWTFNNTATGNVDISSGNLSLGGGGTSDGSFRTRLGTEMNFSGEHDLSGAAFDNAGLMTLTFGTFTFNESVTIDGNVELSGTLDGSAVVTFEDLTWFSGQMAGSGTTRVTNSLDMTGFFGFNGTLESGRTIANVGTATLDGTLTGNNNTTFVNESSGIFTIEEGTDLDRNAGLVRLTNEGTLRPHASIIQWAFDNSGSTVLQGGTVDFQGGYTQTAGETIVPSGAHLRVSSGSLDLRGGALEVTGTIFANVVEMSGGSVMEGGGSASANVVVNNGGTISPGLSPGVLTISGTYTQNAGGTMAIEIGGNSVGTSYDQLAISGTANLDGDLDVLLLGNFLPQLGQSFEILAADGGVNGEFARTNLPRLQGDLGWSVRYGDNNVTLDIVDAPQTGSFIEGVRLFYNNSALDANGAIVDVNDFDAVVTDKAALGFGDTATFDNISGYSRGINGLFIDIDNLPGDGAEIDAADFAFSIGDDDSADNWAEAPSPESIGVLADQGENGSDRVYVTFPDGAITDTWLRVTVKGNADTGLSADEDFFFGSARGETGASFLPGTVGVDAADLQSIAQNLTPLADSGTELITEPNDVNRDRTVNAFDLQVVAVNLDSRVLNLITPQLGASSTSVGVPEPSAFGIGAIMVVVAAVSNLCGRRHRRPRS